MFFIKCLATGLVKLFLFVELKCSLICSFRDVSPIDVALIGTVSYRPHF